MTIPITFSDDNNRPTLHYADEIPPLEVKQALPTKHVSSLQTQKVPYLAWLDGAPVVMPSDNRIKPCRANFPRMTTKFNRHDPLLLAMKRKSTTVIDISAGLGGDAGLLAAAGYRLTLIERNPLLASLLGLAIYLRDEAWYTNLEAVHCTDATEFLTSTDVQSSIIYFDPMYPHDKRKRLTRGPMQVVQSLALADNDNAARVLGIARRATAKHVVVKRSPKAAALAEGVNYEICRKSVRFDIYLPI